MGQVKSYNEQFISKELASIERELIAYKSTQNYGATQVQSRVASVTTTSAAISGNNITTFIFVTHTHTHISPCSWA